MARARGHFDQGTRILNDWISRSRKGLAYALCFESVGALGDNLADVMKESQKSLTELFQSSRWVRQKRRATVVGQITSLSVVGQSDGRWILRRWLVLPTEEPLSVVDRKSIQELADSWVSRISRASGKVSELRDIQPMETASMVRLITGCISPLDRPTADLRDIARDLRIQKPNESIAVMAEQYRRASPVLREQYELARRRDELQRDSGRFGFVNPTESVVTFGEIDVPVAARNFMNYAIDMFRVHTWKLTSTGGSEGSKAWRELSQRAGSGLPKYISFDIRSSVRGAKKV